MKIQSFIILLFLLPVVPAAGQTFDNDCDEITNDNRSIFYNKRFIAEKPSYAVNKSDFNFGISRITTPEDTFACYVRVYASPKKTYNYGSVTLQAEDMGRKVKDVAKNKYWPKFAASRTIKRFKKHIHVKVKAYSAAYAYFLPRDKWLAKCVIADVHYYPFDKKKNTVTYRIKHKKYHPIAKYNLDDAHLSDKEIKKRETRKQHDKAKYTEWITKENSKTPAQKEKESCKWLKKNKLYIELCKKEMQENRN